MSTQNVGIKILEVLQGFFWLVYCYMEALFRQFVPPSMKSIDGETILVTGAVGGIGKEICKRLVKSGSNLKLVIWDLHQSNLDQLAGELKKIGTSDLKVFPFAVDISSRENIEAGCKQIKDTVGPVAIIFNNAGIAPTANFLQLSNEQIEKTIQVNLMSHLWIIRQFLPEMIAINHGRIVNICSMGGLKAASHALPYFASKFAVNGYTEALKLELQLPIYQYNGIHLSTVYPYFVQTPLIRSLTTNAESNNLPSTLNRFLTPEEVARKAVDGMRREYEYIYVPSSIPFILLTDYLLPNKVRKALESRLFTSFVFKDAREQEAFEAPYLLPNAHGKAKRG